MKMSRYRVGEQLTFYGFKLISSGLLPKPRSFLNPPRIIDRDKGAPGRGREQQYLLQSGAAAKRQQQTLQQHSCWALPASALPGLHASPRETLCGVSLS